MSAIVLSGQTTYFYHTGLFREYFRRLLFFRCFLRFTATINFREDIMKKILLSLFSLVIAISLTGCFGTGGPQLPGVNTDEGVDLKKIKTSDYKNNLDDLEKYLTDLKYIPSDAEPTLMMYQVIGATAGNRYNFTVDNSPVYVEIYEYNTDKLNEDAQRVISEVKKNGSFKVFTDKDENDYPAELSSNGKYLLLYTDKSNNDKNVARKKNFIKAVKEFHK